MSPSGRSGQGRTLTNCVSREQLRDGELIADIVEDLCHGSLFFAIVQAQGSPEILFLGQYRSRSDAAEAARHFMADHLNRQQAA